MSLRGKIEKYFENIQNVSKSSPLELRMDVESVIKDLNSGDLRISTKQTSGEWITHEWIKKAILMYFRIMENHEMSVDFSRYFSRGTVKLIDTMYSSNSFSLSWYDKIPLKFSHWNSDDFKKSEIRAVPGSIVRYGSYISKKVILMPSFVNIGSYIGTNTMVDSWATIGSCAQIGNNCHISGGVGIGGVLEPLQANPVIIEDNCFIGARSEISEGVIVEEGSVISMGVYLGQSTKIINRDTGDVTYGRIPRGSVVVPGSVAGKNGISLYCAVIVKTVDEQTRSKTSINDLLRD